jgi:hydrogenase expression/formation protein HypC
MCLAIPGQIVEFTDDARQFALVDVSGVRRTINVDLLRDEPPVPGDWVLIHVGFAMSRISEARAQEQLRLLAMLGEDLKAMEELDGYAFADPPGPSS